jgi:hypothetical protein
MATRLLTDREFGSAPRTLSVHVSDQSERTPLQRCTPRAMESVALAMQRGAGNWATSQYLARVRRTETRSAPSGALQRYVRVNNNAPGVVVNPPGAGVAAPQEFEAQQPLQPGQVGQVLVAGAPAGLRVSEDGQMAIEDSDLTARQPKVFYAHQGVWQASNAALAQSRFELYADRQNAITVTLPAVGAIQLDRVLPRVVIPAAGAGAPRTPGEQGLSLNVDPDCIMIATAILGNPPPAQERELTIVRGAGASRDMGEYRTAAAMLEWARSMSWWSVLWPPSWWERLTQGGRSRAERLTLEKFRAALGGGPGMQAVAQQYAFLRRNNPATADQVAEALGVNVHAEPALGEAFESYQLGLPKNYVHGPGPDFEADPTGATQATLLSPNGAGPPTRHAWGQHIGVVVALSAGNRVTLENYARSHELGAMRTGPDYYFQMYGPPTLPQQTWHHAWTAGAVAAGLPPIKNAVTIVVRQ